MDWAFSVNVMGFLEKKADPLDQVLMKPQISLFGAQVSEAGEAVGLQLRLLKLLHFFPGDPHVKKFGTIWARGREKILQEKKSGVLSFDSDFSE
jgi:hypothetical protein